ncbi:MAG: hypothetical protein K2X91_11350 [Thermoleophilia bacterium]|nr:hypothetical protein [Thermoleophilia bacterium]
MSRRNRRFRPGNWDALEERLALSTVTVGSLSAASRGRAGRPGRIAAAARPVHQTPDQFIAQQYAQYTADVAYAAEAYVTALTASGTGTTSVATTLASPYLPGSGVMVVDSAANFGTPSTTNPLQISAVIGSATVNTYNVTGISGNTLTGVTPTTPSIDPSLAAGTLITAQVDSPNDQTADAGAQYRSFLALRTLALSQSIVAYYNRIPIQLPKLPGPYHTHRPRSAIQQFIANQIAGSSGTSLGMILGATPLPTTGPSALDLYLNTTAATIANSQATVREGIRMIFAGQYVVGLGATSPTIPAF